DDRVAAGEGRPELPARDVRREVPRDDEADDAERLTECRRDTAGHGDRLAGVLVDGARVEVEHLRDHADLGPGPRDRLADVPRLDSRKLLAVLLYERREPAEESRSIGGRDVAPGGKGPLRPRDGGIRIVHPGLLELGD